MASVLLVESFEMVQQAKGSVALSIHFCKYAKTLLFHDAKQQYGVPNFLKQHNNLILNGKTIFQRFPLKLIFQVSDKNKKNVLPICKFPIERPVSCLDATMP